MATLPFALLIRHSVSWTIGLILTLGFLIELSLPRTPEKLTYIANVLFKNEETPLPPAPDDGIEYLNTFLGPNLRFESLGLIFAFFGRAFFTLEDGDERFNLPEVNGLNRKEIAWRMKECADTCLQMCEVSFQTTWILCRTSVRRNRNIHGS